MSNEIKNIEEIENINEEEVMKTETKQGLGTKIVGWGKKNGKKILTGVGVVAVGLLGYALGKKSTGEDEDYFNDDAEFEDLEDNFEDVDSEQEI